MLKFIAENARWLAAGFLLTLTSSYGQTFFVSVFAGEIRGAFGLSHGQWAAIYSLSTLVSAGLMLWAGTLADRFRVRDLAFFVLPLLAAACLMMATAPGAWVLPLAILGLRFAGQGMTVHIAIVAMGRWFVASRGKALSVARLGVTAGEALLPIGFVALLGVASWRALWVVAAVLVLIALPVLAGLLRHERTPASEPHAESATGMGGRHWTRQEMLRHWLFWAVLPLVLGPSTFITALFFHQVHVAAVKDMSHLALVALFPVFTLSSVAAMVLSGMAVDRLGSARLLPFSMVPMAAGFVALAGSQGIAGAALGMGLLGISVGAAATVPNTFWAEFYGTRHLGAIKSVAMAAGVLGSAIGPVLTGVPIDAGIGFDRQMYLIAGYFLITSGLVALAMGRARRYLPSAGEVDIVGT